MLTVAGVNHFYSQSHTLWDVSFEVPDGQCTCIMGRNGVGKTTLAKCLMGLESITSGEINFNGTELHKAACEVRARIGIGYVPQGRQIFPLLSVEENIRTGFFGKAGKPAGVPESVYQMFPVLKEMRRRRGGDLSGGQQQQLAIARALVIEPKLLILDEPAEGIQPNVVQEIADVVNRLNTEHGIAVLLVEQKLPFIRKVSDNFILVDRGRVAASGQLSELDEGLIGEYLTV